MGFSPLKSDIFPLSVRNALEAARLSLRCGTGSFCCIFSGLPVPQCHNGLCSSYLYHICSKIMGL